MTIPSGLLILLMSARRVPESVHCSIVSLSLSKRTLNSRDIPADAYGSLET